MNIFDIVTPQNIVAYWDNTKANQTTYLSDYLFPKKKVMGLEINKISGYAGLPVTSAALIIPLVAIIIEYINVQNIIFPLSVLIAMAVAFISTFKVKKPHTAGKIAVGAAGLVLFVILLLI